MNSRSKQSTFAFLNTESLHPFVTSLNMPIIGIFKLVDDVEINPKQTKAEIHLKDANGINYKGISHCFQQVLTLKPFPSHPTLSQVYDH